MSKTLLVAPSIPFTPAERAETGVLARAVKGLAAPWRWLESRRVASEIAHLSEREWHDIGAGARDPGCGYPEFDDADERAARRVALKAWRPTRLAA